MKLPPAHGGVVDVPAHAPVGLPRPWRRPPCAACSVRSATQTEITHASLRAMGCASACGYGFKAELGLAPLRACSCAAQVQTTRCGAMRRAARPALPAHPELRARRQDEGARDAAATLLAMKAAPREPGLADLLACSPPWHPARWHASRSARSGSSVAALMASRVSDGVADVLVLRGPGAQGRAGREGRATCHRAGLVGPVASAWRPGCAQRACTKASSAG
jgi:hypothetical protein